MDDLTGCVKDTPQAITTTVVGNSLPRVPSFPKLKPHFIIKEYYGKVRRESQTFYLEEKYCQSPNALKSNIEANVISSIDNRDIILSQTKQPKPKQPKSMFESVALFGGAFVGGMLGLYVCNNN